VLFAGGISFAGVIAFVFADLLIVPLVIVYRRYYGPRLTWRLVAIMFVTMVVAALVVDGIFSAAGLVPRHRPSVDSIVARGVSWNYTTFLNVVFLVVAAWLLALTVRRGARDPVCGMTVDRTAGGPTAVHRGRRYFFCGEECRARFDADPERYAKPAAHSAEPR
jgi:uncharacterized protein